MAITTCFDLNGGVLLSVGIRKHLLVNILLGRLHLAFNTDEAESLIEL